jgi:hypothetical protein
MARRGEIIEIERLSASSYYPEWIKTATVKNAGGSLRQMGGAEVEGGGSSSRPICTHRPHFGGGRTRPSIRKESRLKPID